MIRRNIPNAITLGNLLCGCLALICVFGGALLMAASLVGLALVLDFFDGFTARLLKVSSPIGKDLDSLADLVTFGVVPGMVMYSLIQHNCLYLEPRELSALGASPRSEIMGIPASSRPLQYLKFIALLIPLFSAVRLARFNNDSRQSDSFIGVPTPANAMVICSLPLIFMDHSYADDVSTPALVPVDPILLAGLTVLMSFLLVSNLPLFALKFKNFGWKGNEVRFLFLILAMLLMVIFGFAGIPAAIGLYILLSIVNNIFLKPEH